MFRFEWRFIPQPEIKEIFWIYDGVNAKGQKVVRRPFGSVIERDSKAPRALLYFHYEGEAYTYFKEFPTLQDAKQYVEEESYKALLNGVLPPSVENIG